MKGTCIAPMAVSALLSVGLQAQPADQSETLPTIKLLDESLDQIVSSVGIAEPAAMEFFQVLVTLTIKSTTKVFPDQNGDLLPERIPASLLPEAEPYAFSSSSPAGELLSDPARVSVAGMISNATVSPDNVPPPYMRLIETASGYRYVPSGEQPPQETWTYLISRSRKTGELQYHFDLHDIPAYFLIDSLAWTIKSSEQDIPGHPDFPWQAVLDEAHNRAVLVDLNAHHLTLDESLQLIGAIIDCDLIKSGDSIVSHG